MRPPTIANPMHPLRSPSTFASALAVLVLSSAIVSGCGGGEESPSTASSGAASGTGGTSGGSGGSAGKGSGGAGGTAGANATGGSAGAGQNHFTVNVSLSSAIATVGIVE